jgi:glycerate 2-kinase
LCILSSDAIMCGMQTVDRFSTYSFRNHPKGASIQRILAAAIQAVDPGAAVQRFVQRSGEKMRIGNLEYELDPVRKIILIGIGKAAVTMAEPILDMLGERINAGLIVSKYSPENYNERLPLIETGHPVPDERSLLAGLQILDLLAGLDKNDLVICLISGGGSALVTVPKSGISLVDIQELTTHLLACGARIDEINILRRQVDRIKGGGVARAVHPAKLVTLILSDVVGNPLEAIASGPTVADPTTAEDAVNILKKYDLLEKTPTSILNCLAGSPGQKKASKSLFENVHNVVIGSNLQAAQAALVQAQDEGFHPYLLQVDLEGIAREAAIELCSHVRWARMRSDPVPCPACIIAGGETTVVLKGDGKGGRNTELALAAVTELAGFPGVMLVSLATDGEDGGTDAAGAVVTGDTYSRAARLGLHPESYLERNDSYPFFSTLDDLLRPGPTGTNVNDLVFLFTF